MPYIINCKKKYVELYICGIRMGGEEDRVF